MLVASAQISSNTVCCFLQPWGRGHAPSRRVSLPLQDEVGALAQVALSCCSVRGRAQSKVITHKAPAT